MEIEHTLLTKSYFANRIPRPMAERWLSLVDQESELTTIVIPVTKVAPHPEDDLILATAVSGSADYLVTGDRQLQRLGAFQGVAIIGPAAFLGVLTEPRE